MARRRRASDGRKSSNIANLSFEEELYPPVAKRRRSLHAAEYKGVFPSLIFRNHVSIALERRLSDLTILAPCIRLLAGTVAWRGDPTASDRAGMA
jgi:hypothetical protein